MNRHCGSSSEPIEVDIDVSVRATREFETQWRFFRRYPTVRIGPSRCFESRSAVECHRPRSPRSDHESSRCSRILQRVRYRHRAPSPTPSKCRGMATRDTWGGRCNAQMARAGHRSYDRHLLQLVLIQREGLFLILQQDQRLTSCLPRQTPVLLPFDNFRGQTAPRHIRRMVKLAEQESPGQNSRQCRPNRLF
jgi:hypothetical protein